MVIFFFFFFLFFFFFFFFFFEKQEANACVRSTYGETLVLSGGPWAIFAGPERCGSQRRGATPLGRTAAWRIGKSHLRAAPSPRAMVVCSMERTRPAFSKHNDGRRKNCRSVRHQLPCLGDFDSTWSFLIPCTMPQNKRTERGNSVFVFTESLRGQCSIRSS